MVVTKKQVDEARAIADAAASHAQEARAAYEDLWRQRLTEQFNCPVGTKVFSVNRRLVKVGLIEHVVARTWGDGKPPVIVRLLKKDGTPGNQTTTLQDWKLAEEGLHREQSWDAK